MRGNLLTVLQMDGKATQQCNMIPYVYAFHWLQQASLTFLTGRKMQLNGCYDNEIRNVNTQALLE